MKTVQHMPPKILIACEESQTVCKAFRKEDLKHTAAIFRNRPADTRNGTSWAMP